MSRFVNWYQHWATKAPYLTNCSAGFIIAGIGDYFCQKYFEFPNELKSFLENNQNNNNPNNLPQTISMIANDHQQHHHHHHHAFDCNNQLILQSKEHTKVIIKPSEDMSQTILSSSTSSDNILEFEWDLVRSVHMGIIRASVITPFVLFWYPTLVYLCPGQSLFRVLGRVCIDQSIGSPIVILLVFVANAILQQDIQGLPQRIQSQFMNAWKTGLQYWPIVHSFNFGFIPLSHQPLFAHFASVYWNAVLSYYANIQHQEPPTSVLISSLSSDSLKTA